MKKLFKNFLGGAFVSSLLTLPYLALAQSAVQSGLSPLSSSFPDSQIAQSMSVPSLIIAVINILLWIVGGIAVVFVIIGGFWYVTSAGNEEVAEKGKNTVVNAVIGIVIVILSYTIVNVVANLVSY